MSRYERKLSGLTLDGPVRRLGLELYPEENGIAAVSGQGMTQKEFERAFSLLRGYAARAWALSGRTALTGGDLPEREGEDALFWVWFERFRRESDPAKRLMAAYNAFGALPGGFSGCEAAMRHWLGEALAGKLLDQVRVVRREEGDLAEKAQPYERPASWSPSEWAALDRGLCNAGA